MKIFFRDLAMRIIVAIVGSFLRLRYRFEVTGLDQISAQEGGIVFLPNHPAEIDPVIIMYLLSNRFHPRPLVVEHFYYLKGAHIVMQWVGALPMPNIEGSTSRWKMKQVEKLFHQVSDALRNKENFLIYPAGRLKNSQDEVIGGASFVHNLLQEVPDAKIVLVRTTGMWGSSFSKAPTGKTPDFGSVLLQGIKTVLKNAIFFTPRRTVKVEFTPAPSDFPRHAQRLEVNKFIEKWYNKIPDPVTYVSYAFWKRELLDVAGSEKSGLGDSSVAISSEIKQEIISKLALLAHTDMSQIAPDKDLAADLGLDSLDMAQVYAYLDERYEVGAVPLGQLQTVEDVFKAAAGYKKEQKEKTTYIATPSWPEEKSRSPVELPQGETLQEAFLRCCDRMGKAQACADAVSGVLTYRTLKLGALVLSGKIRKMEGKYVGILLPSSVGAYLVILACLLAGKIPVMLNWTAGVRSLDHAVKLCDLKAVISSRRFLNALSNGELGTVDPLLKFVEDVRETISWQDKLYALWLSTKKMPALLRSLKLGRIRKEDPSVILFTSGTEALPKAVPLSHENILSNQRGALSCVDFHQGDVLYGILPPFHSFGFSVTGLLPLLSGLKACYAPDPNDSHGLARDIDHWKVSLFCSAPSFLKALLRAAKPHQLSTVRLFVAGAEKTPQDLFTEVAKLKSQLIEGYGITECSPIVTLNRPGELPVGVGKPLPGIELRTIHSETLELLPPGQEGEICIFGSSVFSGYLGEQKSPFLVLEGKRWYRSGDRGYLDSSGALILTGRLKRFIKIGGEMVSLNGLEEEITRFYPSEGTSFAIIARETEGDKPSIILFTTKPLSKDQVNERLRDSGYGRIVKIAEVKVLEQIPLTGTGKTDYRSLQ